MTAGALLFNSSALIVCSILSASKYTKVTLKSKIITRDILKTKTQEELKGSFSLAKIKSLLCNELILKGANSKTSILNIVPLDRRKAK